MINKDRDFYLAAFANSIKASEVNRTKAFEFFLEWILDGDIGKGELESVEVQLSNNTFRKKVQEWDLASHPKLPGTREYFGSYYYELVLVIFVQIEQHFFYVTGKSKYLVKSQENLEGLLHKKIGFFIKNEVSGMLNLFRYISQYGRQEVSSQELKTNIKLLFEIISKKYFSNRYQAIAVEMYCGFFDEDLKKTTFEQLVYRNKGNKYTLLKEQAKEMRSLNS